MIYFEDFEVFSSVIHALIYGLLFALFYFSALATKKVIYITIPALKSIVIYKKPIYKTEIIKKSTDNDKDEGALFVFIFTLAFFLGFTLLSYYSLDGQFRIYMLLFSLASFLISNLASKKYLIPAFEFLLKRILALTVVFLRIIILPLRFLILRLIKCFKNRVKRQKKPKLANTRY